jgi:hypothetical protein
MSLSFAAQNITVRGGNFTAIGRDLNDRTQQASEREDLQSLIAYLCPNLHI